MAFPTFDKKENIPAGFEDEYEEVDGKWVPIDRAVSLKKTLKEEKEKREAAEAAVKKAVQAAAETAAKAGFKGTEEEYKLMRASVEAEFRALYDPKLADLEKVTGENRALKLDNKVKALFKQHGALETKVDDFWKLHGDEFDLTSDDKPMVKSEPGKDIVKHVQSILKARSEWAVGTKATGGGSNGGNTTRPSGSSQGGLTFDEVVKNPSMAIAAANEG